MAHKDGNESDNDEVRNQMTSQETVSTEEVRVLRHQMEEKCEAWVSGQAPPSSICYYLNTSPIYPPGFGPYANTFNVAGTSTTHQYTSPFKIEKTVKNEEHDEMAKKMKSLE
ncbi:hypothetical protein KY285_015072 [Solanum tuberosum]|nr:hypothetical protein KY285_015072 [Solanum tuberosum]